MTAGELVTTTEKLAKQYMSIVVNADEVSTLDYVLENIGRLNHKEHKTVIGVVKSCFRFKTAA
jgi:hypothetical protein